MAADEGAEAMDRNTSHFFILTHGGASSPPANKDGTDAAAACALRSLRDGGTPLAAATAAVAFLEDDGRFNAGRGSTLRNAPGRQQMDASCMDSSGRFGAIALLEGYRNPIRVARALAMEGNERGAPIFLAAEGAASFAKALCCEPASPPGSYDHMNAAGADTAPCDTVGAVVRAGNIFACALSTGGIKNCALGRIGDVPILGGGIYCGPAGAVVATGHGEAIMRAVLAFRCYTLLAAGEPAAKVAAAALQWVPEESDLGVLLMGSRDQAAAAKKDMAWSAATL